MRVTAKCCPTRRRLSEGVEAVENLGQQACLSFTTALVREALQQLQGKFVLKNLILSLIVACGLAACATPATKMSALQVGMTKAQAIERMGPPNSTSAIAGSEFLNYKLCVSGCVGTPLFIRRNDFYVKLTGGIVESFGNKTDLPATDAPAQANQAAPAKQDDGLYTDLKKLKDLLDSGAITQAEFDTQKQKLLSQ